MMAPAADIIATKFGLTNSSVIAMLTSIFVLGYGRRPRYDSAGLLTNLFSIWPDGIGSTE